MRRCIRVTLPRQKTTAAFAAKALIFTTPIDLGKVNSILAAGKGRGDCLRFGNTLLERRPARNQMRQLCTRIVRRMSMLDMTERAAIPSALFAVQSAGDHGTRHRPCSKRRQLSAFASSIRTMWSFTSDRKPPRSDDPSSQIHSHAATC
ncbi:hypothetical protein [Bradyrhizobium brasilense]|uniref:hypothetical protein n=1 Tax=Bradyrhizobium brasilense TaxID=1419277 RepID=UPI001E5855AD|nr:hypothetical protein [Bradyrhizobium brasilense]MCC8970064.1 hypothetical protein [Bradyrhizobium brasilense]